MQNIIPIHRQSADSTKALHLQIDALQRTVVHLENRITQLGKTYITIPDLSGRRVLQCQEIIRCQANGNYCDLYLADKKRIRISKTLKFVQALLPAETFIRVHQSHVINVHYVEQFQLGKSASLRLKTHDQIPISRSGCHAISNFYQ